MRTLALLLLLSIGFSACATTTTIQSVPPGARVYIDDQVVGQTPVQFSDSSLFFIDRKLDLRLQGYEEKEVPLKKTQLRVGMLIGALLVTLPVFWILGYPEAITYELDPAKPAQAATAPIPTR